MRPRLGRGNAFLGDSWMGFTHHYGCAADATVGTHTPAFISATGNAYAPNIWLKHALHCIRKLGSHCLLTAWLFYLTSVARLRPRSSHSLKPFPTCSTAPRTLLPHPCSQHSLMIRCLLKVIDIQSTHLRSVVGGLTPAQNIATVCACSSFPY